MTDRLSGAAGHARGGGPALLEREPVVDVLLGAVATAVTGHGCAAILTGEAGIGKTSVVRALRASLDHGVRVLAGACDDLLSPRALGPLREAAAGTTGPLAAALAGSRHGESDAVPAATVAELAGWRPTVLIVEDLHWADDATLDVLGHVGRRLADLPALLVLTYRDDEVPLAHPLRRVLGALTASTVHRFALPPLSPAAVAGLAAGSGRDSTALHTLTGGNPFYVTETLAAPGDTVPATVADAVLARVGRLDPACRDAVEQLSVVPTAVELGLARRLLGPRFDALIPAEEQGVLQVRDDGLAFRGGRGRHGADEAVARGYTNLSEMLYRYARFAELDEVLGDGLAFTDEHGFPSHAYNLNVHRCLLALRRGDWAAAESGLEALVDQDDDPGMLAGHSRPPYGRLLARRGVAGSGQLLALELAASGEPAPTLEALRTLEDLGAHAAVRHVRRRLRELGITRVPRRPTADTRAHPAGLTRRQADVLALIADGLTNAEIADELVLSVRTVDTHVAAILDRLGVRSRREAASVARTLDLTDEIQPQEPR